MVEPVIPEQEFARVVALAKLRPENVTATMARQIEEYLKHYTPEAAASHLRSVWGGG